MKVTQIKRLIKKHIEPNLPGYSVHKESLYKLQDNFFLTGYYFESRGNEDLDLAVWYFIHPLFSNVDYLTLTLGGRLSYKRRINFFKSEKLEWWDAREENLDSSFHSILKSIQEQGEPFLNSVQTAKDFYSKFKRLKKENVNIYKVVAFSTILFGNENLQNKELKGLLKFCSFQIDDEDDKVEILIRENAQTLLHAGTSEKRLEILKQWSNEAMDGLKLPFLTRFNN